MTVVAATRADLTAAAVAADALHAALDAAHNTLAWVAEAATD